MTPANYQTYNDVVKLWVHEFDRVVSDRMFTISEVEHFRLMMEDTMKKDLSVANPNELIPENCIYTNFANSASGLYLPIADMESLQQTVDNKL